MKRLTLAATFALTLISLTPVLAGTGYAVKPLVVASIADKQSSSDAKIIEIEPVDIPSFDKYFHERIGSSKDAKISIHLDSSGLVSDVKIIKTSGYDGIDQSALSVVRNAKYSPAMLDGKAVGGDYLVDVDLHDSN